MDMIQILEMHSLDMSRILENQSIGDVQEALRDTANAPMGQQARHHLQFEEGASNPRQGQGTDQTEQVPTLKQECFLRFDRLLWKQWAFPNHKNGGQHFLISLSYHLDLSIMEHHLSSLDEPVLLENILMILLVLEHKLILHLPKDMNHQARSLQVGILTFIPVVNRILGLRVVSERRFPRITTSTPTAAITRMAWRYKILEMKENNGREEGIFQRRRPII